MPRPQKSRKRPRAQLKRRIPMMVALAMEPDMEIRQRQAVTGLVQGWGGADQFDELVDCRDFLVLGAGVKQDDGILALCDAVLEVLSALRSRYDATGKLVLEGDEATVLSTMVDVSQDFWGRVSGEFFIQARRAFWEVRRA